MNCRHCGSGLSGLPDDRTFACTSCRTAWELDGGDLRHHPLSFRGEQTPGGVFLPFWLVDCIVTVRGRLARRPETSSPLPFPRDLDPTAEQLSPADPPGSGLPSERLLAVPAFACERAPRIGLEVTRAIAGQEPSSPSQQRSFGAVLSSAEAADLLPGVVLAEEFEACHGLAAAEVETTPLRTSFAGILFVRVEKGFQLAGRRLLLPYNSVPDSRAIIDSSDRARSGSTTAG